jgi:5-methylthioribose kinase
MLDQGSVLPYLRQRGLLTGDATVETLTGGVSCIVLAVSNEQVDLVVKQALPELKTKVKWVADQRRAIVEANAMRVYHQITPESVPELIDCDTEEFTLTMSRLPRSCTNWKIDMLEARIHPEIGGKLGLILAKWHNAAAISKEIKAEFMEDSLFEQLRVAPFYRAVAAVNPQLNQVINALIAEITQIKTTLVHGDFSPKNIMATTENRPIVLDFEVAHTGNPVFDLAFLLAHLLCKVIRTEDKAQKELLLATATQFLNTYEVNTQLPVAESLPRHIALIALARVEGVSPVNYLDQPAQQHLIAITKAALLDSDMSFEMLFESANQ